MTARQEPGDNEVSRLQNPHVVKYGTFEALGTFGTSMALCCYLSCYHPSTIRLYRVLSNALVVFTFQYSPQQSPRYKRFYLRICALRYNLPALLPRSLSRITFTLSGRQSFIKLTMGRVESGDAEYAKNSEEIVIATASAGEIATEATCAIKAEHALGFWQALRLYPQAVGWSVFFSLGVIMCAFDPQLMGQLYAVPAFQRDFGFKVNVRRAMNYWICVLRFLGRLCHSSFMANRVKHGQSARSGRGCPSGWLSDGMVRSKEGKF